MDNITRLKKGFSVISFGVVYDLEWLYLIIKVMSNCHNQYLLKTQYFLILDHTKSVSSRFTISGLTPYGDDHIQNKSDSNDFVLVSIICD